MSTQFESRIDGEYALCRSCQRSGYGPDAWHPATLEFWRRREGQISFTKCRACVSEVAAGKMGIVVLREAA